MPRIEVAAEHHDFVPSCRCPESPRWCCKRSCLPDTPVDDVELELDRRAVGEDARDAAVVLVPHHDGRHRLREVVRAVVERDDLAVLAARRRSRALSRPLATRNASTCSLICAVVIGGGGPDRTAAAAAEELSGVGLFEGSYCARTCSSIAPLGGRIQVDRRQRCAARRARCAPSPFCTLVFEKCGELLRRRLVGQDHVVAGRRHRTVRCRASTRRPRRSTDPSRER